MRLIYLHALLYMVLFLCLLASDSERFGYSQAGIIKKENETEQSSLQNTENIINIDDVVAKLKKEPNDEYIIPEYSFNEILEPQTILTIDEDENDGFPIISSEQSSENFENFINIDDVVAKLKKEPDDEFISAQTSTNEILGVQPVLTIKQEIIDEDEKAGLPVISSYSSLAVSSPPTLPLKPTIIKTSAVNRTAKVTTESASTVGKMVQPPSSHVVVYGLSPNTYKVVKCLSVNSGTYSASQYKSYLPNVPMRISLQKF